MSVYRSRERRATTTQRLKAESGRASERAGSASTLWAPVVVCFEEARPERLKVDPRHRQEGLVWRHWWGRAQGGGQALASLTIIIIITTIIPFAIFDFANLVLVLTITLIIFFIFKVSKGPRTWTRVLSLVASAKRPPSGATLAHRGSNREIEAPSPPSNIPFSTLILIRSSDSFRSGRPLLPDANGTSIWPCSASLGRVEDDADAS